MTVKVVGFDYETTSPQRGGRFAIHECKVVGYSLSTGPGDAIYVGGRPPAELFGQGIKFICHQAKFEIIQTRNLGLELPDFEDTKLAAFLVGELSTHLKHLTKQLLDIEPITYAMATGGKDMGELDPASIVDYAAADADHTLRLWTEHLAPAMDRLGVRKLYDEVEKPLVPVLAAMEARGIYLDAAEARSTRKAFLRRSHGALLRARFYGLPSGVSLTSSNKLGRWLSDAGAPVRDRTPAAGLPVTDANHLGWIRGQGWRSRLMDAILEFKNFTKLAQFPTQYLKLVDEDGVLHYNINQCGSWDDTSEDTTESPITGRLSMSGPNLNQIPHHGRGKDDTYERYGDAIRSCLRARAGYVFLAADVAQQEPRITAVVAPEPQLLKDFAEGRSPYGPMGEAIYGYPIGKHTHKPEWHTSKTFFLAYVYGCEWTKLLEIDPHMSLEQAKAGYERVARKYLGLPDFRERVIAEARAEGLTRDYFGRIRKLPGLKSVDTGVRMEAERQAVNMQIQGPAATMLKMAMLRLDERLEGLDAHLLLPTHDEVLLEVREDLVDTVARMVYPIMDGIMPIEMPMEVSVGRDLGKMREYEGKAG
jgi:DNA polymerase-1